MDDGRTVGDVRWGSFSDKMLPGTWPVKSLYTHAHTWFCIKTSRLSWSDARG